MKVVIAAGICPPVGLISALTTVNLLPSVLVPQSEVPPDASVATMQLEDTQQHNDYQGCLCTAWSAMELSLQEVLLQSLPQTPPESQIVQLRERLLLRHSLRIALIEAASWGQLTLLCHYALQVG